MSSIGRRFERASSSVFSVISPANLGPDSGFDFEHIKVGHRMTVSGRAFMLGKARHLTIRAAQAN